MTTSRSRIARMALVVAAVLACLAPALPVAASATSERPTARRTTALDLDLYETQVLRQVNRQRTAHGLHPVRRINRCVDRLSESWAAHLAETGEFYHRDQHVVLRRCHMYWAGEALARGTGLLPAGAVSAWMHSPEHRAVILKRRADRGGIAARLDGTGRVVLVLNFTDN